MKPKSRPVAFSLYGLSFLLTTFLSFSTSCGTGPLFRSTSKLMDETRKGVAELRETVKDTRSKLDIIWPLAALGAAGAIFTSFKTLRRLRRR